MQDVAMDNKTIFLGCGAGSPELNTRVADNYDRYKYWFRVTPNSNYLGQTNFIIVAMVAGKIRAELGIGTPKVAILVEEAVWADSIVAAASGLVPGVPGLADMGMEAVGVWRPSPTATDVGAELMEIEESGANIILTAFSGPVGIPYAKQWGELEIPAASVGLNVEAMKEGFWDATVGKGNYELTLNTFAPGVKITDETIPFVDRFSDRFGELPTVQASTYDALYILQAAIESAGTLDSDAVVAQLENTDHIEAAGRIVFDETHDLKWGPGYVTTVGTQWQDGELKAVWPPPGGEWQGVDYEGTVDYMLPPWIVGE